MNKLRFRSGQVFLVKVPVDSNTQIEAGDMVWLDAGRVKPASAFPFINNWGDMQRAFVEKFLGIAHQQSNDGDTNPISVDVSPLSIYEMDIDTSLPISIGDTFSPTFANPRQLLNQMLYRSEADRSIARTAEFTQMGRTTLRMSFASAFCTASANAHARLGSLTIDV